MSAPFMQLYVADYLGDTRHLTTEQHGAYLLLLMAAWRSGGVLQDDDSRLARIAGLTASRWGKIKGDVLAFFQPCEGGITQARLAAELAIAEEKSQKRSQAGKAGGRAKALKDNKSGLANAKRLSWHSPEPEPDKEEETTSLVRLTPHSVSKSVFESAWKAYPAKGRERSKSQAKTLPVWRDASRAAGGDDRLLAAVKRYVLNDQTHKGECGAPAFDRWLRDGRWEHWLPSEANAVSMTEMNPELAAQRRALLMGDPNA